MTQQRQVIYQVIRNASRHMTAGEIFQRARRHLPSIAVGTVYRNLNLMIEAGEIRRVAIAGQADRFDKTVQLHHHSICPCCGEVSDVKLSDLTKHLSRTVGRSIESYELTLRMRCDACEM